MVVFGRLRFFCHGFPKMGFPRMWEFRSALSDVIAKPVTHFAHAVSAGVQYLSFSWLATCLILSGPLLVSSVIFFWPMSDSFLLKSVAYASVLYLVFSRSFILRVFQNSSMSGMLKPPSLMGRDIWARDMGYDFLLKIKLLIFFCRSSHHFFVGDGRTRALWVYLDSMKVLSATVLPMGVNIRRDQNFILSSISFPIVSKFWSVSVALHVKFIPRSLNVVSKARGMVGSKGVGSLFSQCLCTLFWIGLPLVRIFF